VNQTYTNLEIIIVVSTSKDHSAEICDEYAGKDKRITVIHTEALGISVARNIGLEEAVGDYISFIDADDYIAYDFIEVLYSICSRNNADIAQCNYVRGIGDACQCHFKKTNAEVVFYSNHDMCLKLATPDWVRYVVVWNKLYKTTIFADIRFPAGRISEDHATTHKAFYRAYKIAVTTDILYFYRIRPTSITESGFHLGKLDHIFFGKERILYFHENNENAIENALLVRYYLDLFEYLYHVMRNVDSATIKSELLSELRETSHELKSRGLISSSQKIYISVRLLLIKLQKRSKVFIFMQAIIRKLYRWMIIRVRWNHN
jgi:glycosyltransferase involved in cell wall biosynthesis